jgi:hypothetical protein
MSNQSLHDIQIAIDNLFKKMESAKTGGEISQYSHALRVQITKKKNLGGSLMDRERALIKSIGEISQPREGGQFGKLWLAILIIAVIAGFYFAYKHLR